MLIYIFVFKGIAGVGSVGGRVYLVDLALDEAGESTDTEPATLALFTHPAPTRDIPGSVAPLSHLNAVYYWLS